MWPGQRRAVILMESFGSRTLSLEHNSLKSGENVCPSEKHCIGHKCASDMAWRRIIPLLSLGSPQGPVCPSMG